MVLLWDRGLMNIVHSVVEGVWRHHLPHLLILNELARRRGTLVVMIDANLWSSEAQFFLVGASLSMVLLFWDLLLSAGEIGSRTISLDVPESFAASKLGLVQGLYGLALWQKYFPALLWLHENIIIMIKGNNFLLLAHQLSEWRRDNTSTVLGWLLEMVTLLLYAKTLAGVDRLLGRYLFLLLCRMNGRCWIARWRFRCGDFAAFLRVGWFARRTENTPFSRLILHWIHLLRVHHWDSLGWTGGLDKWATHLRLWGTHRPFVEEVCGCFWVRIFVGRQLFGQLFRQIMINLCHLRSLNFPLL